MNLEFYKPTMDEYDQYTEHYRRCIQLCAESSFWAIWDMANTMEAKRAYYKGFYWHQVQLHGENLWMPPIGDWDSVDWSKLLQEVVPSGTVFGYMPEYLVNQWVKSFPGKIGRLEVMTGESDYIYYIDRQAALEGSKYRSIRGQINRFSKEYGECAVFRRFTQEDIPAIKEFQVWWMQENDKLGKTCEDLNTEHHMIMQMLDEWQHMRDMQGAILLIDGKLAAYVIVAELDTHVAEEHILKADYSYKGIYQYMHERIYSELLKEYTFLNSWGDGGIEGLRATKLAQNPLTMLRKYIISWEG